MWEKGGAEWRGWCQEVASASLSVPLSAPNEGKQKGPVSSWLLAMAGTDRLGDDALRIFKIAPSQRL